MAYGTDGDTMEQIVAVPAKLGCTGCIYEEADTCPADTEEKLVYDFSKCSSEKEALIFVRKEEQK